MIKYELYALTFDGNYSLLTGNILTAQLDNLVVRDSRFGVTNPSSYDRIFIPQLKYYTASGLPQVGTGFSTLFGFRGWATDNSGGKAHELAFVDNSHMYIRSGNATTWESWKRIIIEDNGKVGIGTLSPQMSLDIKNNLRLGTLDELPAEGSILEANFGNYIIGDAQTAQKLRLGVSNDGYTKAEIMIDNSNGPGGSMAFKTSTGMTGAVSRMFIDQNGNVSIGTDDAKNYRFAVNGDAMFTKIKVKTFSTWPDYVFDVNYDLRPLNEVKKYVRINKHLPEVPNACEVEKEGIDIASTQSILLKKIEELTLYLIDQNDRLEKQERKISEQHNEIKKLKAD